MIIRFVYLMTSHIYFEYSSSQIQCLLLNSRINFLSMTSMQCLYKRKLSKEPARAARFTKFVKCLHKF